MYVADGVSEKQIASLVESSSAKAWTIQFGFFIGFEEKF